MLFDKRRNNQFFHSLMRQVMESVLSVTFQKTDLIQIADTRLILKENCSLASIGITSFVIFPTKRAFAFLKFSFSGIHTEIWKIIYFLFSCKFRFHFRNVFCFLNLCIRILFEIRKIVYFHFSFAIALSFFRIRFAFLFQRKNSFGRCQLIGEYGRAMLSSGFLVRVLLLRTFLSFFILSSAVSSEKGASSS